MNVPWKGLLHPILGRLQILTFELLFCVEKNIDLFISEGEFNRKVNYIENTAIYNS